ncbi:LOW QUALITY PROTEIN: hypothetical protein HID58_048399, partial [Brassica napus]
MDRHIDPINNCVSRDFKEGVDVFIAFSSNQNSFLVGKTMLCPCLKCQNRKQRDARTVSRHLYRVGFKSNYYLWSSQGENYYDVGGSSAGGPFMGEETYQENFPDIMGGGTGSTHRYLTDDDYTVMHKFLMLNCPTFEPYKRMFEEFMMERNPSICGNDLQIAKDNHFAEWVKNYVICRTSASDWWACTKVVPRGVQETSKVVLTALQDDTRNQVVAQSEMLRIESYVVVDDSDYDSTPVVPPYDEYISEDELEESYVRYLRPQLRTASMPAVTTPAPAPAPAPAQPIGPSCSGSAAPPAAPPTYVRRIEDALLRAPSRINQPHLHPDKPNGALWFGVDPEFHAFIRATWQGDYWGPWQSWIKQQYYWEDSLHEEIHFKWKLQTQVSICGRISQKRKKNKIPKYISKNDWKIVLANWSTDEAKAKSQSAADSRTSAPVGLKMHVHGAGPRYFVNIGYRMMIDQGLDALPSYTDLARKTHTRKDGTFMDERTEQLVLEVEQAVEEMLEDGSPVGDCQTCSNAATENSKHLLLNQEYIMVIISLAHYICFFLLFVEKTRKSTIYGLGSVQFNNKHPSESVPASLNRNIGLETRVCGLETISQEIKSDFQTLKSDVQAIKTNFNQGMAKTQSSLDMILQFLQPQASNHASFTAQPTQSQAPSQAPPQGQAPSPARDMSPAQGESQPQHITSNNSELDRWCNT